MTNDSKLTTTLDDLVRVIHRVEADDFGSFTVGVTREAAENIAHAILPLLAEAWDEGSRAGWFDRTRSIFDARVMRYTPPTPNPYRGEA